jgi:lipid II:glycine glycyltransferase (peptidoglycan interpeptide bridge formation enzyme)
MIFNVSHKKPEELFASPIVQQTAFWHKVKQQMGVESIALNYSTNNEYVESSTTGQSNVLSDILVFIQYFDRQNSIAYIPYGPELTPLEGLEGVFLEELSECLRPYLPSSCMAIRYDLFWESLWAKDEDFFDGKGWWLGPPEAPMQELRLNFSTVKWKLRKSTSNVLPTNTVFLNLLPGEDWLLNQMKPKTRYNIGLSRRKGVTVKQMDLDQLGVWYQLYSETAQRNDIFLHNIEYFAAVLSAKANNTLSPAEVILLFAEVDGIPLAAMFLVISGSRASYLYGASSSVNRNYMATYAIQWEAIRIARQKGCSEYDMFGVAPRPDSSHPMYGLYRFKSGFGGEMYHTLGCWDYPLDNDRYNFLSTMEMVSQGYRVS